MSVATTTELWQRETSRGRLSGTTIALATLAAFVALTAAIGAVFVVPALPNDLYRYAYLYGPTAPAAGLGFVAAISFAALFGVLTRSRFGAALSIAAGGALVLFELVESFAVGSVLTPPAGVAGPGDGALWLQPLYMGAGLAMVVLGGRSATVLTSRGSPQFLGYTRFASRATAIALAALTLGAGAFYGWAAASTGTSMYARFFAWGDGTTYDWSRFPSRPLPAAASPTSSRRRCSRTT